MCSPNASKSVSMQMSQYFDQIASEVCILVLFIVTAAAAAAAAAAATVSPSISL